MNRYINSNNLKRSLTKFNSQKPFPYTIVDNFFKASIAKRLEKEFPKYDSKSLHTYNNYCEIKKSSNNWNFFPALTYEIFTILNSNEIIKLICKKLKIKKLFPDYGLNGGGWHMMGDKGRLNPHLDYSLHPKVRGQRKFNLIIFLTKNWKNKYGGETCFFSKSKKRNIPGKMSVKITPKFNRAVFFDTSKMSWHSVNPIKVKKIRKSIAVYYLIPFINKNKPSKRQKALYAPTQKQSNDKKVLRFIKLRSNSTSFSKVYKT